MINLKNINRSISKTMNLPKLNYSENRQYSAIVVEEIRSYSPQIIKQFDKQIRTWMKAIKKENGKCEPSDFLLFITPIEICEAALSAIQQCKE